MMSALFLCLRSFFHSCLVFIYHGMTPVGNASSVYLEGQTDRQTDKQTDIFTFLGQKIFSRRQTTSSLPVYIYSPLPLSVLYSL